SSRTDLLTSTFTGSNRIELVSRATFHSKHLNTPRLVADAAGTTVWRWDQQEPFGSNPADEDPDANSVAFDLPLRLPGQRLDAETQLQYNMARDYWPDGGRYIQSDPHGVHAELNTYAYAAGSPLRFSDPTGEDILCGPGRNTVGTNPDGSVKCVDNGRGPNEKVCATAACAAGIGPLPSENRPESAIKMAQCTWTCKVVLMPPMACVQPTGVWWFDMPSKSVIKGGVCDWFCN
ncbi:MAG: RHS repeat domain-containing protein, partial [Burkholderiales bacterium]